MENSDSRQSSAPCFAAPDVNNPSLTAAAKADGRYVVRIKGGQLLAASPISEDAAVVDPDSYAHVLHFLNERVPHALLMMVLNETRKQRNQ